MRTKLDDRADLTQKVKQMSALDAQKLNIFLAGMEAGKALQAVGDSLSGVQQDLNGETEKGKCARKKGLK